MLGRTPTFCEVHCEGAVPVNAETGASRQSMLLPSRSLHARWQGPVGLCVQTPDCKQHLFDLRTFYGINAIIRDALRGDQEISLCKHLVGS